MKKLVYRPDDYKQPPKKLVFEDAPLADVEKELDQQYAAMNIKLEENSDAE
jgi:hypothetical protein